MTFAALDQSYVEVSCIDPATGTRWRRDEIVHWAMSSGRRKMEFPSNMSHWEEDTIGVEGDSGSDVCRQDCLHECVA